MNEHTAPSGSKRSLLSRLVRFFLKAVGAFLALIVLLVMSVSGPALAEGDSSPIS